MARQLTFYLDRPDKHIARMILQRGHRVQIHENKGYDIQLYTGGEDVSPFLYGEYRNPKTKMDIKRDNSSNLLFRSKEVMFPRVGICRGAQFLAVMSGDKLWQDVDNHRVQSHPIKLVGEDTTFNVSSTHHQMIRLHPDSASIVLAYANRGTKYEDQYEVVLKQTDHFNRQFVWDDPEVLYYWNTNSLCFQYHPEFGPIEGRDYFWKKVEEHFLPKEAT